MSDTFDPGRAEELAERLTATDHYTPVPSNMDTEAAEMLRAACARVAELTKERDEAHEEIGKANKLAQEAHAILSNAFVMPEVHLLPRIRRLGEMSQKFKTDRDRLAARVKELEKLAREACDELAAASRWIGSTQYRVDDATHKQFAAHVTETAVELRSRLGSR